MGKIDLDELERLAAQATHLPWKVSDIDDRYIVDGSGKRELARVSMRYKPYPERAEYIAAACNAVPDIVKECKAIETKNADLTAKLEKRTNQLLLLVDKYADIVSCKYCPLNKECSADDQIDADPILCGMLITEWLEKAIKEAGE